MADFIITSSGRDELGADFVTLSGDQVDFLSGQMAIFADGPCLPVVSAIFEAGQTVVRFAAGSLGGRSYDSLTVP